MVHEVGHNLGMSHDFQGPNGNQARIAKDGSTCTGIGSLMDYGANNGGTSNLEKWSQCSKEDLTSYYNRAGGSARFCLNNDNGSGENPGNNKKLPCLWLRGRKVRITGE